MSTRHFLEQNRTYGHEEIDEGSEEALLNYVVTGEGKYRCRDCGRLFDTLEAHDWHYRSAHVHAEAFPIQGMTM